MISGSSSSGVTGATWLLVEIVARLDFDSNEVFGVAIVDAAQRVEGLDELLEQGRVQAQVVLADSVLAFEQQLLGELGVGAEQSPVEVASVADVHVLDVLEHFEDALDDGLALGRRNERELDAGGQQLQLDLAGLLLEVVQENLQYGFRLVDVVDVLADDPEQGGLGVGLVDGLDFVHDLDQDFFVALGVLAEDVWSAHL